MTPLALVVVVVGLVVVVALVVVAAPSTTGKPFPEVTVVDVALVVVVVPPLTIGKSEVHFNHNLRKTSSPSGTAEDVLEAVPVSIVASRTKTLVESAP